MPLPTLAPETRNLIDGAQCDASNGNTFDSMNPANDEELGQTTDGTKDDMLRAVDAARRAFDETEGSEDKDFRGERQTGVGRENGVMGFEEFLGTKGIAIPADAKAGK